MHNLPYTFLFDIETLKANVAFALAREGEGLLSFVVDRQVRREKVLLFWLNGQSDIKTVVELRRGQLYCSAQSTRPVRHRPVTEYRREVTASTAAFHSVS
ncbi:hypothetical protein EVAR_53876_1 [Eumeta japonica]|uniref:Uncharacterized protein n=1 Tax=Eumeta variegata TaxID=151549 RepID=A0A4C1XFB3_EUMVA|nr:hypothetical protein EVAR_53876_1 [Eumeta japonica]